MIVCEQLFFKKKSVKNRFKKYKLVLLFLTNKETISILHPLRFLLAKRISKDDLSFLFCYLYFKGVLTEILFITHNYFLSILDGEK